MEMGSKYYGKEIMNGKVRVFKGVIGYVISNRKIVFNCSFPITLFSPYFEWQIKPSGSNTIFTAITIVRCKKIYRKIMGKKDGIN